MVEQLLSMHKALHSIPANTPTPPKKSYDEFSILVTAHYSHIYSGCENPAHLLPHLEGVSGASWVTRLVLCRAMPGA